MKARDLRLEELVRFSEGFVDLHGRRLVMHDTHAFGQTRKDLFDLVGPDQCRRILTRFGYFWGKSDAAAMERIFTWENTLEWLKAGPRMHTLQGVTRAVIQKLSFEKSTSAFHMEVTWHNSGEAEEHLDSIGRSSTSVCWMLSGYMSGYSSYCTGSPVYFVETRCHAKGDPLCTAVGRDRNSWGNGLLDHIRFFEVVDIHEKVSRLTRILRAKETQRRKERSHFKAAPGYAPSFVEVHSEAFNKVLDMSTRIARYDSTVLITGETGTGKEVLARYIHRISPRSKFPFHSINCSALPEALLEGELFGHKSGAFTGATQDRTGLFEDAQGGTLFLDEIGELSLPVQVKLLQVLQEHSIRRLGENKLRTIDVRIIAATNRILPDAINAGKFREDLYYRLAVVEIEVPPLRDRREDIVTLARYSLGQLAQTMKIPQLRFDASCIDILENYSWPGNIRELFHAVERAALLSKDGTIYPEHFPPRLLSEGEVVRHERKLASLAELERAHVRTVLSSVNGNRLKAARILGISPVTLWRKLRGTPRKG